MQSTTLLSYALAVSVSLLSACSTGDKSDFSDVDAEILEIHDEVMPKLEDLNHYAEEIRSKISQLDSLQQEGVSSNTIAEQRLRATDILSKLNAADSLMWEWMRGYEADSAKALSNVEETSRYFEQEKTKILDVKEKTEASIREAQSFLEN
jgi:hypothetical protein